MRAGDSAARLARRACEMFGWGAPTRCRLYLVREGRERALAVRDEPLLAAGILVRANELDPDACVAAGAHRPGHGARRWRGLFRGLPVCAERAPPRERGLRPRFCLGATLAMLQLELFVEEGATTRAHHGA